MVMVRKNHLYLPALTRCYCNGIAAGVPFNLTKRRVVIWIVMAKLLYEIGYGLITEQKNSGPQSGIYYNYRLWV